MGKRVKQTNNQYAKYQRYALDVVEGRVVACRLVKLACERYLKLFDNPKYVFCPEAVDKVVRFIGKFKHSTGRFRGKRFELLPFQFFFVCNIYGFYHSDDPQRRLTRYVYYEVARKNAKSSLISIILLYETFAEHEAQCVISANNYRQAKDIYKITQSYLRTIDPKGKYFESLRDNIRIGDKRLFVVNGKSSSLDGLNISAFVLDEAHEQRDSSLYDVLNSSMGMRDNPLSLICTTAGFSKDGFCYGYRNSCIDILDGKTEDDSLFAIIYTLDDGDDYTNPDTWIKSNPSLGEIVKYDFLESEIQRSKNNSTLKLGVITKNLNIWLDSSQAWVSSDLIAKAMQDCPKYEDIDLSDWDRYELSVGVDLASVSDLTAVSYCIKDLHTDDYYFYTDCYLPEDTIESSQNSYLYRQWIAQGHLRTTPTNYTDYDVILGDIISRHTDDCHIKAILYDSYNATQFVVNASEQGLPMQPYSQALASFNQPTREFERLLLQGKIHIQHNPLVRWAFGNVNLKIDHNGNCKPDKSKSKGEAQKIDPVVAMIQALAYHLKQSESVYIG